MSALTPQRVFLFACAVLLSASAYAAYPSSRGNARMVFDEDAGQAVLFGGESGVDSATLIPYDSSETWIWNGSRWRQVFPSTTPPRRSAHAMVYDQRDKHIVMFGGRQARTVSDGQISLLNDTWVYDNDNWSQVPAGNSPQGRHAHAMGYDPVRDRVVLFGGVHQKDATTFESINDTWEFDGQNWTKIDVAAEPKVFGPMLTWDKLNRKMMLLGADDKAATVMYFYDPAARTWQQQTPTCPSGAGNCKPVPDCVLGGVMTSRNNGSIIAHGGVCSALTSSTDETWEWNGLNWYKLDITTARGTGMANTYDTWRHTVITYGGYDAGLTTPRSLTVLFHDDWLVATLTSRPVPRSQAAFRTDPNTNTIYLLGGLNELASFYIDDFWGYRNQQWFRVTATGTPVDCAAPLSAYDTDRKKLVVLCSGTELTFEFADNAWKQIEPKDKPVARRFASMVYDENIKKTVLFGGFDASGNYRRDTWTWDGTNWTEVKNNRPPARSSMTMWYDPLMKRTVFYSGLGRNSLDERITRYSDMYSFDGSGWTKMNVTSTPGERFGAAAAVDPRNGKLVLFGGLKSEITDPEKNTRTQFFANDTWIWDGAASTWTRVATTSQPVARQNASMAYDPVAQQLVLFAGYSAFYYSDTWGFDGQNWQPLGEAPGRKRPTGGVSTPQTPTTVDPSGGD